MNSAISWSVKGIEPEVREAAKIEARKCGKTLGQWLNTMILDISERGAGEQERDQAPPRRSILRPAADPVQERIGQLEHQLTALTQAQTDTAIGQRYSAANMSPSENAALQSILERLERNEEATMLTMEVVQDRVRTMAQELREAPDRSAGEHAAELQSADMAAFERALENVVDHIEGADRENRDTLADLHTRLNALSTLVESGPKNIEAANRKILSEVEHRLTALGHRVDQIGQFDQDRLRADFEDKLSGLATQVERIGKAAPDDLKESVETRLAELALKIETTERDTSQAQSELNETVDKRLQHLTERLEEIGRESEQTATRVAGAAVQSARDDFREIETQVQNLAARIQAAPTADPETKGTISDLVNQISGLSRDVQQIRLEVASEQDVQSLRAMFDDLSSTMDRRFTETSNDAAMAQLEQRLGEISQRIDRPDQSDEPNPQIETLERRLQDIDTRLAADRGQAPDNEAIAGLGSQLEGLSGRIGSVEQHFSGIQAIEKSIAQLFEGVDQSRNYASAVAEQTASRMIEQLRGEQGSPESPDTMNALEQGLQALRATADTADKRNQETLEAVHDTLETVILRLVALEESPQGPLVDVVPVASNEAMEPAEAVETDAAVEYAETAETGEFLDTENGGIDTSDLADLKLPPIPPMPSPHGFNAAPADGAEDPAPAVDVEEAAVEEAAAELMGDIHPDGSPETPAVAQHGAAQPQGGPSLVDMVAADKTSNRNNFIAAARSAAQVAADLPGVDAPGQKARKGRRGKRAKQAGEAAGGRRRPLILAAIVLLMIGAASAYTMLGGKPVLTSQDNASALPDIQLIPPPAETAEPADTPAPAETPVALPNDQQSRVPGPAGQSTRQVSGRSDMEPLNALIPVTTADKQSLAALPAPDPDTLTTGSINADNRTAPDQIIAPTDPLMLAVQGIAAPDSIPAAENTTPAAANTQAPEITGSTTASRTPAAPAKTATKRSISEPAVPNVKNLPPREVGPMGLRVAAAAGDPVAQFVVATKYAEGGKLKQDFRKAAQWYQKAAASGLAPAQYRLATFYEKGKGVPMDVAAARIWYERAAEKGNRKAMHNLAVIYADGSRGTPNFAKAGIWFRNAAEMGLKDSQYNLAILHERGLGVPKDLGQAYKWFALAARQGDADADSRMFKVESRMARQALIEAKIEVQNWSPKSPDRAANVVTTPANGWQSPTAATNSTSFTNAEMITEAQRLLNDLGYAAGPADGLMGDRTRGAIRLFEKASNMAETGTVTPNLLTALKNRAG